MNFKFTVLKTIIAALVGIFSPIFISQNMCTGSCPPISYSIRDMLFLRLDGMINSGLIMWVISIFVFLVVYIIWSLVEKK